MDKKLTLALLSLSFILFPIYIYASSIIYTLENVNAITPDIAVVLGSGTAGASQIGVNGTSADVTVSYPIINPNFTYGSGTDAYNWTENPSANIAVEWDSSAQNMHMYVSGKKILEEATCNQSFSYTENGPSEAVLTFQYTVDVWKLLDAMTIKVRLTVPNGTTYTVWSTSTTGTVAWTWASVDLLPYMKDTGTYNLILYVYYDTSAATAAEGSMRWDDVGRGVEYDYTLSVISQKAYDQNIMLTLYNYSNIDRLSNCTIWFRDATTSLQINITNGVVVQDVGPWYLLPASETRYIVVYAEESASGTSILYIRLEAVKAGSIVYTCLIKLTVN